MTIVAGGKQCLCGNLGCWERYASTASVVELYAGDSPRSSFRSKLTFDEIVKRAKEREAVPDTVTFAEAIAAPSAGARTTGTAGGVVSIGGFGVSEPPQLHAEAVRTAARTARRRIGTSGSNGDFYHAPHPFRGVSWAAAAPLPLTRQRGGGAVAPSAAR